MIPLRLAIQLRDAGLEWKPGPGDQFAIPDRDMDNEVFVLSSMTIEVHEMPEGPLIGFNGTTEWALDDLAKEEAVWLPREDQLRDLLGKAFRRLDRADGGYRVSARYGGETVEFVAPGAAEAYGAAVLDAIARAGPRSG